MHVCVSNERHGSLPGSQELELCKHDQVTDERLATPHKALLEWQPHGRDRQRLETRRADPLLPTTSEPRIDKPANRKQQTDSRKGRIGALIRVARRVDSYLHRAGGLLRTAPVGP